MKSENARVYFPNLNGLRAIGACIVMVGHIEFIKQFWKIPAYQWFPIPGKIGVTLFFALSGFLITSLLLNELKTKSTIALKKFYARRILRIWPLYYLIVILSIFIFNQLELLKIPGLSDRVLSDLTPLNVAILVLLLPNFTHYYIPYADQRWSIIVEEQFYLVQPLIVKLLKKRKYLVIAFVIAVFLPEIIRLTETLVSSGSERSQSIVNSLYIQAKYLACIAVGCLFSLVYYDRENALKVLMFNTRFQWLVLFVLLGSVLVGHYILNTEETLDYRLYTLLFAIIVLNASQNPHNIFRLETRALNFLGSISYGIYMYHPVCIGFAIAIAIKATADLVWQNLIIYGISLPLTILVSWFSFRYFESFFLKLKHKVSPVNTLKS